MTATEQGTLLGSTCRDCGAPIPYCGHGRKRSLCESCYPAAFPPRKSPTNNRRGQSVDVTPTARATDPESSHLAAKSNEPTFENDMGRVLLALVDNGPMHDFDMTLAVSRAQGKERKQTSLGVRRKGLVTLGLVERAPVKPQPNADGALCIVWRATPEGIARARELRDDT